MQGHAMGIHTLPELCAEAADAAGCATFVYPAKYFINGCYCCAQPDPGTPNQPFWSVYNVVEKMDSHSICENTYKSTAGSSICTVCPFWHTSLEGSLMFSACELLATCPEGFIGTPPEGFMLVCVVKGEIGQCKDICVHSDKYSCTQICNTHLQIYTYSSICCLMDM